MKSKRAKAICISESLPHPPAAVWRALTEPDLIERWLAANDFELSRGHWFTLRMEPIPAADFDGTTSCQVLDFEPERWLRISWLAGRLRTTVTWTLHPEDGGTLLVTKHEGFDPEDPVNEMAFKGMSSGWPSIVMEDLKRVLQELSYARANRVPHQP